VTDANFQQEGKQDSCNDLLNRQNRGKISPSFTSFNTCGWQLSGPQDLLGLSITVSDDNTI